MPYELTFTQQPAFLHAIVTGANTKENIARCLDDVRRECTRRGCRRVLIEDRFEGPRLSTMAVYELVSAFCAGSAGAFDAIAYVDVNAESDRNLKFGENVAVNRGLPKRMFLSLDDATKWLESRAGMDASQPVPVTAGALGR